MEHDNLNCMRAPTNNKRPKGKRTGGTKSGEQGCLGKFEQLELFSRSELLDPEMLVWDLKLGRLVTLREALARSVRRLVGEADPTRDGTDSKWLGDN